VKGNCQRIAGRWLHVLEKEQRKALRREAKEIRVAYGRLWGEDKETKRQREKLEARYQEISRVLQEERERVLKECHAIWEEYAALRADQDEQRETLMARYKEFYHVLRKEKEDKANVQPGSNEDIPSPRELAEGRQPPGSEVVFDFSSFVVSEEHQAPPADALPPSQQPTQVGSPLPTFSETGEVTHTPDAEPAVAPDEDPHEEKVSEVDNADFTLPSFEETGGLPVFSPEDLTEAQKESAGKLDDEVWVANEEQASEKKSISSLDDLDLSDLLGEGTGTGSAPQAPKAAPTPKAPAPAQEGPPKEKNAGADAAWDSSPDGNFPQSFKRDGNTGHGVEETSLPPLPEPPRPDTGKQEDETTDSGAWDNVPKHGTQTGGAATPTSPKESGDDDESDVVFG